MKVFSSMLDGLVIRTAVDPPVVRAFANQNRMSIVNAMTADEHPTQALADLITMKKYFWELTGLHIVYFGEGNNTTTALALAIAKFLNMRIRFFTPPGYSIDPLLLKFA